MTLDMALPMIKAAEAKAKEIGVPMVVTVLDGGGNMVAQHRMDDALLVSVEVSLNKAYSAVAVKLPTDTLGELSQPGAMLYGLQNASRMIIFGGGVPVKVDGKIIGGLGVSGGSVEEDMQCMNAGLAAFAGK
ncbi:heme-binding protein [Desulforhopalus sp. IMCC35007]|nr:heme-binding protein [Desulforhopalus sp. IMCC35007]